MTGFADSEYGMSILDNAAQMKDVLRYHVVPNATLTAARLKALAAKSPDSTFIMKTSQGDTINATLEGDMLMVNGAPVEGSESQGGKTALIVIDSVVLPPSMAPAQFGQGTLPGKSVPVLFPKAKKEESGAAAAALGAALALPALLAALL